MKSGGDANPDLICPKGFEVFAKEATLGASATKRTVPELAERVRENAAQIDETDETAEKRPKLIGGRCEDVISRVK